MHNTGNDIESNDILDFEDNTVNLDILMNADQEYWTDRLGNKRPTIDYALRMAGFTPAGFDFTTGGVLKNGDRNKCVFNQADQTWYSWSGDLPYNVIAGSVPGEGWKVVNRNALTIAREGLRRTYLEAGYNLVEGSFEEGGELVNSNDVLLQERTGKVFSGPAGTVPAGTNPASGGFVDQSDTINKLNWRREGDLRGWGYVGDYFLADGVTKNPAPTDNRAAWVAAIADAKPGGYIIVPRGMSGYVSHGDGTIFIPKNVNVLQWSPQYCDNDAHDFALWDYDGDGQQFGDFRFDIRPTNLSPTWSKPLEVGLRIRNCQEIESKVRAVWGFYTGLELIGENNKGVAHCTFDLGLMFDNKIDIRIYGTGVDGYVNQNTFNQGQFITSSTLNQANSKFAVIIDHEGSYKHNGNVFYNPSFEKKSDPAQDNVAILIRKGRSNIFNNVRAEMKNGRAIMRTEGDSERNVATYLYSNGITPLINASTATNNIVSAAYEAQYDHEVFSIGDFSRHIKNPTPDQATSVDLDMWRGSASDPFYWLDTTKFTVSNKAVSIASGHAVGRLVNVSVAKRIRANASFIGGTTGRIVMIPYDTNMTPITDLTGFKTINSQVIASEGATFGGGGFTGGVNAATQAYIVEIPDNCAFIWIGAYAKGGTAICGQLSVDSTQTTGWGVLRPAPGFTSNVIPTAGGEVNDFFYKLNRTQEQSKGWSYAGGGWFAE